MFRQLKICRTAVLVVFVVTNILTTASFAWEPPKPRHPDCVVPTVDIAEGKPGDTVEIGIDFSNVHSNGLETYDLNILYDSYDLQILKIEPGEVIESYESNFTYSVDPSRNSIRIAYSDATKGSELIKTNGEVAKISAMVKPNAINGLSEVTLFDFEHKIYEGELISTYQTWTRLPSEKGGVLIDGGKENQLKISLETINGKPGDVLDIPIVLSDLPRVTSLKFAVEYDPDLLEIIDVAPGKTITDSNLMRFFHAIDPYYCRINNSELIGIIFSYELTDLTEKRQILFDGEFAVITAKVKDDAKDNSFAAIRFVDPTTPGMDNNTIRYTSVSPDRIELETSDGGVSIGTPQILGDLNGNKRVESTDLSYLKRYILGIITEFPVKDGKTAADLNRDGKIDSTDYTLLKRYILGIISEFPF